MPGPAASSRARVDGVSDGSTGGRAPPGAASCLEGSITIEHADGSFETARAGEVYHWPAGHTGTTSEACAFLEVGPVAEMRAFSEHAQKLFAEA